MALRHVNCSSLDAERFLHTDLNDFYPAYQAWQQHLPGQHLPYSAVEVPFLPVPGCTVQLDLCIYAP